MRTTLWRRTLTGIAGIALAVSLIPTVNAEASPALKAADAHFLHVSDRLTEIEASSSGNVLVGRSRGAGVDVLTVIDTVSGQIAKQRTAATDIWDIAVHPKGTSVFTVHPGSKKTRACNVTEFDTRTLRSIRTFVVGELCDHLVISRDGRTLYIADLNHILIVDARSGRVSARIEYRGLIEDLTLSPDGRFVYAAEAQQDAVISISTESRTQSGTMWVPTSARQPDWLERVLVSPDSRTVYAISNHAIYIVPQSGSARPTRVPIPHEHQSVALSRDGKKLYIGLQNRLIVWDTEARRFRKAIEDTASITSLTESPDGRRLYFAARGSVVTFGATPQLVYPDPTLAARKGKSFVSTRPVFRYGWDLQWYTVTPALPKGLRLNPETGVISGVPSETQGTRTYRVSTTKYDADSGVTTQPTARITITITK
ncbi:putative Ig domain-containing protein [Microbacterium oleivorans]|uniref:putative Ig domain-containing protein n=1 Tax=Microbacterium oleivorans TaxID=273677 RepID=UPI00203F33E7|nr:putative Ig domain-containing protein [Microbacterium oleivorans]MCM3694874.1 putative Ig domain-containing protein [Microbacterium oleivorans]